MLQTWYSPGMTNMQAKTTTRTGRTQDDRIEEKASEYKNDEEEGDSSTEDANSEHENQETNKQTKKEFDIMSVPANLRHYFLDFDTLTDEQKEKLFPNTPQGASKDDIEKLPLNTFKAETHRPKTKILEKCLICLEKFANGEQVRRLPCFHFFHKKEIDTWLSQNHVCPVCRLPIDQF
ncbi:hypothetical protein RFI_14946 [Reticulomyxa filosa]|uniref:RING-type domain-containing protein n=1 Tax=Reticulomyxa filosa TaxID=46433 RepID=X6N8M1_RETFI|nr:hypothetical protein RFI_14946 [Reticulomyxa filosa]|eukprot:ETO22258.1 hypothetical protein RFI_14946 [Reticulomyxa filosa]